MGFKSDAALGKALDFFLHVLYLNNNARQPVKGELVNARGEPQLASTSTTAIPGQPPPEPPKPSQGVHGSRDMSVEVFTVTQRRLV